MNACVNWSRFQAYTVELESMVTQLEEEHARLLREEVKNFSHGGLDWFTSKFYLPYCRLLADEQIFLFFFLDSNSKLVYWQLDYDDISIRC